MSVRYVLSFPDQKLQIRIEDPALPRKVFYWDTLCKAAPLSDQEILLFFKKIQTRFGSRLDTLCFQQIELNYLEGAEAMRLLAGTGRVFYRGKILHCNWSKEAEVEWEGDDAGLFVPFFRCGDQKIPFAECEKIFRSWFLWKDHAFSWISDVSWKWIEPFLKGPLFLEESRKKRFLEESPLVHWKEASPTLFLTDPNGCFANLGREHPAWEKDLLEAGYLRKTVGNTHFFAPKEKVQEALLLLLDVGWEIFLADGRRLYRQTGLKWEVKQEKGMLAIRGEAFFGGKKAVFNGLNLWLGIDPTSAGLLDPSKGKPLVERQGEVLEIQQRESALLLPLLHEAGVDWDGNTLQLVRGLQNRASLTLAPPSASFAGELLPHQQEGVNWLSFLYERGLSGLLCDEMGLGKTVQILAFFSRLKTNLPILVVAPSSLLFHWKSEIERFLPSGKVSLFSGSDRVLEVSDCQYVITSYALLRKEIDLLSKVEWEVVVLDESSSIKTASTQTAQSAFCLKARFKAALNGTPMENRPEELASQFRFLMPGLIRDMSLDAFKARPFVLRRKKDTLDLPEKIEQIVWVEMESGQESLYHSYLQSLRSGLLQKVAADGMGGHRMEVLEAILRLRQICIDPRLVDSTMTIGSKVEQVVADVHEALQEKRKVLIYSQFTSVLSLIGKELGLPFLYLDGSVSLSERSERVRRFQEDPEASLFLLSLKAGGVGLNLTAADYVFLVDPWWNEAVEQQAIDRAHRIGRKQTVIAKRYLVPNSIEENMLKLKKEKRQAIEGFLTSASCYAKEGAPSSDLFLDPAGSCRERLKNRELGSEASQIFHSAQQAVFEDTACSKDEKFEGKPILSKTDSSTTSSIAKETKNLNWTEEDLLSLLS